MTEIVLSEKGKQIKKGIYEHYKGKKYRVLGVVVHSESLNELVLYKALYGERLVWVRPLSMFLEDVEIDGRVRPRFKFLREK